MFGSYIELVIAAMAGLISHWTFFVHGEHDLTAAKIARLYILALMLLPVMSWTLKDIPIRQALKESMVIDTVYVVTLFSSITMFRLFVSPLRRIPGPFVLRLTKLTHVWDMAQYQNCQVLHEYHRTYGDLVRTGRSNSVYCSIKIFLSLMFMSCIFQGSLPSCYYLASRMRPGYQTE